MRVTQKQIKESLGAEMRISKDAVAYLSDVLKDGPFNEEDFAYIMKSVSQAARNAGRSTVSSSHAKFVVNTFMHGMQKSVNVLSHKVSKHTTNAQNYPDEPEPAPKSRGQKPQREDIDGDDYLDENDEEQPKRRGRKPKVQQQEETPVQFEPKRRGRPALIEQPTLTRRGRRPAIGAF